MIKLRKALLIDSIFYLIFIISLLITIIRLGLNNKYQTPKEGIIINITEYENIKKIEIKENKKLVIYDYSKKKNSYDIGDKIQIKGSKEIMNSIVIIKTNHIKIIKKNKNILYKMKQLIKNNINNKPYLSTFLLGDKSLIEYKVIYSYQENGISHLFAISGMHITLLSSILEKILKKRIGEEKTFYMITTVLLGYLFLVGLSPSILRGVLFYIFFRINQIYYFYIKKENIFLIIISISLMVNPNYLWEVGFQYSYLISFSLLRLTEQLKSKNYVISLLKTSIASFLVSIPISLYHFSQINLLSIFYNLFYVPYVSIILFPFTLIVFIIKPLYPIYNFLIIILEKSSLFLSQINFGKIPFKKSHLLLYVGYGVIIFLYLIIQKKEIIYIFLIILIFHFLIPKIDNTKMIEIMNVSQGDSILIQINHINILLDTGGIQSKNIFYKNLQPNLRKNGISKIHYLIISHGDFDHMGEAMNVVNNFKVEKVVFNCGPYNTLEKELINFLEKKKIKYYSCIKELNLDNDKLYFLQTKEYDNENDNSNVIYTELNGYKFMFMGDASTTTEKEILNKYNLPDIDVLKVGHHGSRTSSSKEFIDEINPRYSVISVGKNNRYGHPNKEALDNLRESKIYRTDEDGSIMFKIKNNELKIRTCSP